MQVAIIHDWLNGMRGGEKVLEALLEVFPGATIHTLFHEPGKVSSFIESHQIVTSPLNRIPWVYRYYRNLLPLFPAAIQSFDLAGFDLVISSSHAVAKGVRTPILDASHYRASVPRHICYCHTPMRYIWDAEEDYAFGPVQRIAMNALRSRMRRWDCETAAHVDSFIANSQFVSNRIRSYYGRDAEVIHPPVDTAFFMPATASDQTKRNDFYLAVGALVPYKRLDLIIEAFNLLGRHLVVAGAGPEMKKLQKIAKSTIDFRGHVSDDALRDLYRSAKALIVAAREDFGMSTVEAQSCGCPVIAFAAGGSAEIVHDGVNGILFEEQHADHIVRAVQRLDMTAWPAEQVRSQVETFSRETFQNKIRRFIEERADVRLGAISEFQTA
jgi:glycosyltransferase involved in cell wall biosynthesis